eukprot:13584275-Alexandrium_andersonii.AAC.1
MQASPPPPRAIVSLGVPGAATECLWGTQSWQPEVELGPAGPRSAVCPWLWNDAGVGQRAS